MRRGLGSISVTLTDTLSALEEVEILNNTPVERISMSESGVEVTAGGTTLQAEHVFSALPAHALADILQASGDPAVTSMQSKNRTGRQQSISGLLREGVPYAGIAVANLAFKEKVLPHEGFGHLIPFSEQNNEKGRSVPF